MLVCALQHPFSAARLKCALLPQAHCAVTDGWLFADRFGIGLACCRNGPDQAGSRKARHTLKFADAQQKQENQIKAVRGFIAQGVDAILIAPVVATGWDAVLKEAKEAEIPVVLLDRQIDSPEDLYLTAVTSDQVHEGKVAGEWLVKDVGDKPCNVVELQGTTGSSPAINRKKGFEEAMPVMTTSRFPARRPATSPAPRARKSWKASSRPKTAARISARLRP
jgi:hypothetical protein